MKMNLIIASVVGALISAVFIVVDPHVDYALLSWQMPGISAAYLFWGAVGGAVFIGVAICWVVNTVVYGVGAFAVLAALGFAR
jgi:hypothetical protein